MAVSLAGRVALVTGASGCLGIAVSRTLLDAGATVVGIGRNFRDPLGDGFVPVRADLTTEQGAKEAVDHALRQGKRLDILAHIMGGFAGVSPVAETDVETWDYMINLNLRAAFLTIRAVLPPMVAASYGRIIAVGSRAAMEPTSGLAAYGVSKAGLSHLVQTVAEEVRDKGITANVVVPSVIDTPANREAMPDADPAAWVPPEAIARQIAWLCSEEAADVSGALLPVYGRA